LRAYCYCVARGLSQVDGQVIAAPAPRSLCQTVQTRRGARFAVCVGVIAETGLEMDVRASGALFYPQRRRGGAWDVLFGLAPQNTGQASENKQDFFKIT
jgi:hypothetical protein